MKSKNDSYIHAFIEMHTLFYEYLQNVRKKESILLCKHFTTSFFTNILLPQIQTLLIQNAANITFMRKSCS